MSKATLAVILSRLKRFEKPKTHLEQYVTPSDAAATILWDAAQRGLIQNKHVVDLGAGTGILGIGALLLGAKKVTFIEIDKEAAQLIEKNLKLAKEHVEEVTGEYDIRINDATEEIELVADLAVTNPPFGTKKKGADLAIIKNALTIAPHCYSFHKSTTDEHLKKVFAALRAQPTERFAFTFNLAATMPQHEKKAHHVAISCWHIVRDKNNQ